MRSINFVSTFFSEQIIQRLRSLVKQSFASSKANYRARRNSEKNEKTEFAVIDVKIGYKYAKYRRRAEYAIEYYCRKPRTGQPDEKHVHGGQSQPQRREYDENAQLFYAFAKH